jgi:Uma2 family endonuclease
MVMLAQHNDWTVDMLDALAEDGQRYELIDGVLYVTPAPRKDHQLVVGYLFSLLRAYMREGRVGRALMSPSDIRRGDRLRNRVQPDLYVAQLDGPDWREVDWVVADLLLVVEVLSPRRHEYDLEIKRDLYLREQVGEYWVIDADRRTLTRFRVAGESPEVLTGGLVWQPAGMSKPFVLDLPAFFEEAFA